MAGPLLTLLPLLPASFLARLPIGFCRLLPFWPLCLRRLAAHLLALLPLPGLLLCYIASLAPLPASLQLAPLPLLSDPLLAPLPLLPSPLLAPLPLLPA